MHNQKIMIFEFSFKTEVIAFWSQTFQIYPLQNAVEALALTITNPLNLRTVRPVSALM